MPRGTKNFGNVRGINARFNTETAREAAKKSVERKRQKKLERDVAELFASCVPDVDVAALNEKFGLNPKDERTAYEIAFARAVVQPAMSGDIDALKVWAAMRGIDGECVRDRLKFEFEMAKMALQTNGQSGDDARVEVVEL